MEALRDRKKFFLQHAARMVALGRSREAQNNFVEMTFVRCVIVGSTSSGQQPNGPTQTSIVQFIDSTIYGYNSVEAGGDVTFTRCQLVVSRSRWLPRSFTKYSDPVGFDVVTGVQSLL